MSFGNIVFYSLVVFFISFGIISFLVSVTDFFFETKFLKDKKLYTVLFVKNEACAVENLVRAVVFKIEKSDLGVCDHKIIVVDDNSSDHTYEMLKKLSKSENRISILKKNELIEKIKST